MAQYRAIHTKVTQSFDFNEMPDDFTRLMWVLLPLGLDKEGRGIFNTSWIRSKLFPLREDVTANKITAALDWMLNRGMIIQYEVDGRQYFYVPTFKMYQRVEREAESVLPTPDILMSNSGVTHDLLTTNSCLKGIKGNEIKEKEKEVSNPAPASFIPLSISQTGDSFVIQVFSNVTGMSAIPGGDMPKVLPAIDALRAKYPTVDALTAYLKPYYAYWQTKKTKDGRPFSKSNCAWLYDWAVAGDPLPTDKHPVAKPDPDCPKCGGHGFYKVRTDDIHDPMFGKSKVCECVKVREEVDA